MSDTVCGVDHTPNAFFLAYLNQLLPWHEHTRNRGYAVYDRDKAIATGLERKVGWLDRERCLAVSFLHFLDLRAERGDDRCMRRGERVQDFFNGRTRCLRTISEILDGF